MLFCLRPRLESPPRSTSLAPRLQPSEGRPVPTDQLLRQIRSELQAQHRTLLAIAAPSTTPTSSSLLFQKASKNPPAKPRRIKGRISPIRLFHKVWVMKQESIGPSSTFRPSESEIRS